MVERHLLNLKKTGGGQVVEVISLCRIILACPHKVKSVDLSAVNLSILLQINRFGLFVSPKELSICQSLDLISTISENNSGISIFGFCTILRDRDGWQYIVLPTSVYYGLLCFTLF